MAIDNTPPRLRLIATIAIIMVITLISLDFVFKSYFAFMTDEAKHEKIAPKAALLEQLGIEKAAFAEAKVPVDQAMAQVAKGTRPDLIEPKPSEDMAPMTGWAKMPKQPPAPAPADPHAATTPATTGDAGADITDAGAAMTDAALPIPTTTMVDAGAPATAPTPAHTGMRTPGHL